MDSNTTKILKRLDFHQKVRKILTLGSYFSIFCGILMFVFFAIDKSNQKYKLVADIKKNKQKYQSEKIMINPKIRFQHTDNQIYKIKAKRATHKNNEEVTLFDVYAEGEIGNITSGELQIYENGNHLIFSQNPVLILKNEN